MVFLKDFIPECGTSAKSVAISSDLIIFDGLKDIESFALRLQFSRKI